MSKIDRTYRRACKCNDCTRARHALSLLDDIATSPAMMGVSDIERLCEARQTLASILGHTYDKGLNRYTAVVLPSSPNIPRT